MIFTPPSDMSVIMQSRGNPPVANCIFAKFLHARRSLERRFAANMSNLALLDVTHPEDASGLQKNCSNWPSAAARNVIDMFELRLPNPNPSRSPWVRDGWLTAAGDDAPRRNFRQIKGLIPPR